MFFPKKLEHRLRDYINHDKPFGPIKAEDINTRDLEINNLLFDQHNQLYDLIAQNPKIIIGRKGSGKTAYLKSVYISNKYNFITNINTADTFVKIIECISEMLPAAVFSEKVADLWQAIIEISIMATVLQEDEVASYSLPDVREYLIKIGVWNLSSADEVVWRVVNFIRDNIGKTTSLGIVAEALAQVHDMTSNTSHSRCRSLFFEYLLRSGQRAVVLIDTLDEYNLETDEVSDAIAGLLKCVGSFNTEQHSADIRLCIPSELYHVFVRASSNPAKDFESQVLLHWHPRELILLASQRFQLYLRLYYPNYYEHFKDKNLDQFENALELLETFMPTEVTNGLKFSESTIVYFLRHTQLTPRHFLLILNNVFKHRKQAQGRPRVKRDDIVKGVAASEALLTEEIFASYKHVYKHAKSVAERCIPELPFLFHYSKMNEVFEQIGKNVFAQGDIYEFKRMLIEMGIIGKFRKSEGHYHEALFEYTVSNQLHSSLDDSFCCHPLFLNKFSSKYGESDGMTVYPIGIDPYTDDDYRLVN